MPDVLDPGGQVRADRVHAAEQPVPLDGVEHRERGSARDRVTAERAAVIAPLSTVPNRPMPMHAPIGRPPPSPFASVITSGSHALALMREPRAGPADPALDLVEHQQRTRRVARIAAALQVPVRGGNDAAFAEGRLQEHGRAVGPTASAARRNRRTART